MQPFIGQGDKTSHGGTVLAGSPFSDCSGKPIARVGDMVACPKCKGVFPIAEGDKSNIVDGAPADWFATYEVDGGVVFQAGPKPETAHVDRDPMPAIYVLPNLVLKDVRIDSIGSLHYGSKEGEPRLTGLAAEQWLCRFDVSEHELINFRTKLQAEEKLTPASIL